mmetsp:Transcript_74042/g.195171  ORF Transcript_74042/g.195171 Transcript_74042/m.195171 type:complete len:634 (-) Transcript_74042:268-2169(-)
MQAIQMLQRGVVVKAVSLIQPPSKFPTGHFVAGSMGAMMSVYQEMDKFSGIPTPKARKADPSAGLVAADVQKFDAPVRAGHAEAEEMMDKFCSIPAPKALIVDPPASFSAAEMQKFDSPARAEPAEASALALGAPGFARAYEELESLGRGEFGEVRLARHRATGALCAVKHLPLASAGEDPSQSKEIDLMSKMHHTNVVTMKDTFKTDKELLVVMEYCDQGSLSAVLCKRHGSRRLGASNECALLMRQLLSALEHCHSLGYEHSDLKFDNIMVASAPEEEEGGRPEVLKLIDFGNARPISTAPISDPCFENDDVWFAGVLFFELITGQMFFIQDPSQLESLEEQGLYVDPGRMACGEEYIELRLAAAKHCADDMALDLLSKMLRLNKAKRIDIQDALDHPFLSSVVPRKLAASGRDRSTSLDSASTASIERVWTDGSKVSGSTGIDALENSTPAIVVLGQSLNPDGSTPATLLERAEAAASLHLSTASRPPIIATGGDVAGTGTSEAEVMRKLLRALGVPDAKIILEPRAKNTLQNAWESVPMLPQGCDEIFLVTSDFHMPRSAYLFEAVFASKDIHISVVQHPARSGCQAVPETGEQQSDKSGFSTIKAQSTLVRARKEVQFINHEVVQVGL